MAKVVAISGLGDDTSPSSSAPLLVWGIVIGAAVGIFVGTLLINPKKRRS